MTASLDLVEIPCLGKESAVNVDLVQEKMMKEPYVVGIVAIETVVKGKGHEKGVPLATKLTSYVNP